MKIKTLNFWRVGSIVAVIVLSLFLVNNAFAVRWWALSFIELGVRGEEDLCRDGMIIMHESSSTSGGSNETYEITLNIFEPDQALIDSKDESGLNFDLSKYPRILDHSFIVEDLLPIKGEAETPQYCGGFSAACGATFAEWNTTQPVSNRLESLVGHLGTCYFLTMKKRSLQLLETVESKIELLSIF